jgi:UDP-galactopyranose mutase
MKKRGKKCLVIDKRNHIGGNIYCEKIDDINVHKYGELCREVEFFIKK